MDSFAPRVAVLCLVLEGEEGLLRLNESIRSFTACGATGLFIADLAAVPRVVEDMLKGSALRDVTVLHRPNCARNFIYNELALLAVKQNYEFGILARSHDLLKQTTDGQLVESLPLNLRELDVLQVSSDAGLRPRVDVCVRLSMFYFVGALDPVPVPRADSVAWLYLEGKHVRAQSWDNVSLTSLTFTQSMLRAAELALHARMALEKWKRFVSRAANVTPHDRLVMYILLMQAATACLYSGQSAEALRLYQCLELEDVNDDRELYFAAQLGACRAALRDDSALPSLSLFASTAEMGLQLGCTDGLVMLHRALMARSAPQTAAALLMHAASCGPRPAGFMTDPSLMTYRTRAFLALTSASSEAARAVAQYRPAAVNDDDCIKAMRQVMQPAQHAELPATIAAQLPPVMTLCQPQFCYHPGFVLDAPKLFDALLLHSSPLHAQAAILPGWPALLHAFQRAVMPTRAAAWGAMYQDMSGERNVRNNNLILFHSGVPVNSDIRASIGYLILVFRSACTVVLPDACKIKCEPGSLLGVHDTLSCSFKHSDAPVLVAQIVPIDL